MPSPRSFWYPIAAILGVVNVLGLGFAAAAGEPAHAALHAGLALAFGVGAARIRAAGGRRALEAERAAGLEALEDEVDELRQELSEAQERLDFAERLLARREDQPGVRQGG